MKHISEYLLDGINSMAEAVTEREAIKAADNIPFDEDERHRCEVSWVIRAFYPRNEEAKEYFQKVEKHRGKEAADRLRDDARKAWQKRNQVKRGES